MVNIVFMNKFKDFCIFVIIEYCEIEIAVESVLRSTCIKPILTRKCRFSSFDRKINCSSKSRINSDKQGLSMHNFSINDNTKVKPT